MKAKVNRAATTRQILAAIAISTITLLLVVAIIFPYFAKARECAQCGPYCASNLKQLGLGFIQYVQDYDGKWPAGGDHWAGTIYSYEKSTGVYHCPEDPTQELSTPAYPISYAMNANLRGKPQGALSAPQSTVLATDCDGTPQCNFTIPERTSRYTTGVEPNTAWGGIRLGTTESVANAPRHDPSIMFLSADGHVKLLRPEKVSSGLDSPSTSGAQDATHAAGAKSVGAPGSPYTLTFSER